MCWRGGTLHCAGVVIIASQHEGKSTFYVLRQASRNICSTIGMFPGIRWVCFSPTAALPSALPSAGSAFTNIQTVLKSQTSNGFPDSPQLRFDKLVKPLAGPDSLLDAVPGTSSIPIPKVASSFSTASYFNHVCPYARNEFLFFVALRTDAIFQCQNNNSISILQKSTDPGLRVSSFLPISVSFQRQISNWEI
jgi:hypothetical protein